MPHKISGIPGKSLVFPHTVLINDVERCEREKGLYVTSCSILRSAQQLYVTSIFTCFTHRQRIILEFLSFFSLFLGFPAVCHQNFARFTDLTVKKYRNFGLPNKIAKNTGIPRGILLPSIPLLPV